MLKAIEAFSESLNRAEHLGGLHKALAGLTTAAVDSSDLLRAQLVLGVSALDYYVHEITVLGMLEVLDGRRPATPAFLKFRVSVTGILGRSTPPPATWFESEVRERHSFLSFQQPDKVSDAIRLFTGIKLWHLVSGKLTMSEQEVKSQLKLIVDRRNKIAHEADLDPSYPNTRWPIHIADVEQSLTFLRRLGKAIHEVIS